MGMKKRLVVCADGTWNRPEEDPDKDFPTNVLKLARAIKPIGSDGIPQQVFYDWGVGSYYSRVRGGVTGKGLHKNIMDDYRYIVQNYKHGDEIFLFGFSRGAYTIRSLCGMINNCGIIKRPNASRIQEAFEIYKKRGSVNSPSGKNAINFRKSYSHISRKIEFAGVWDTVGAMGIPISFLGLFDDRDEFYDTKIGRNVEIARHAMAIDEHRSDFEPTIWQHRPNMDMKQVWFAGAHSDVGGSYEPDTDGSLAADTPLSWLMSEARGLSTELHLKQNLKEKITASLHDSRRNFYRIRRKVHREIDHQHGSVLIHSSVKKRWDAAGENYRPKNLASYISKVNGWSNVDLEP
jgi:uncharacterized protein (DUF2235 family)